MRLQTKKRDNTITWYLSISYGIILLFTVAACLFLSIEVWRTNMIMKVQHKVSRTCPTQMNSRVWKIPSARQGYLYGSKSMFSITRTLFAIYIMVRVCYYHGAYSLFVGRRVNLLLPSFRLQTFHYIVF